MGFRHLAAVAVTMAVGVSVCTASAQACDRLIWSADLCPDGYRGVECATLTVPVDYHDPRAGTIGIAVSRLKTTSSARRGVLVVNQGGPAPHLGDTMGFDHTAPELAKSYDVISFDQRGFGHSAPVACQVPADRQVLIPWPRPGGFAEDVRVAQDIAKTCVEQNGPVLAHMGTAYVARDMELLRKAIGEDKISYLGLSYGSYPGTAYASLFPEHTDRVVLADVASPTRMWRGLWQRSLGDGLEIRFPDFGRFATDLGHSPAEVRDRFIAIAADLDHTPLPTPAGVLGGNEFRMATYAAMKDDSMFPTLARLARAVLARDAGTAADAARQVGTWAVDPTGQMPARLLGVSCDDASWPRSPAVYEPETRADAARYPLSAGAGSNIWPCAFWPYPVDEQVRVNPRAQRNILILNNTRDPSTPMANAVELRAAFADRARLVTVDGGGHGSYLYTKNTCANAAGNRFLTGGPLPAADTFCPENP
ncbi:alpha/beta hydrolase [Actinocrispum wychmicini]|nr:alpha/beta hydrolase [Actinocrispum wychmicini]